MCQPGGSASPGWNSGSDRANARRRWFAGTGVTTSVDVLRRPMYVLSASRLSSVVAISLLLSGLNYLNYERERAVRGVRRLVRKWRPIPDLHSRRRAGHALRDR